MIERTNIPLDFRPSRLCWMRPHLTAGMPVAVEFDMSKVTTTPSLHTLGRELRFARLFLLRCKLTLSQSTYLNLKRKIGGLSAFEIMRVALLTGGTAAQHLKFDSVNMERPFRHLSELEIENNRSGLVRWNKMEVVKRSVQRFELEITCCMFHELAVSVGIPELPPIVLPDRLCDA